MSILQLKRGTAEAVASYTPAAGEVVIDTTNWRLAIGDGNTVGGKPLKIKTGTSGDNVPLLSGSNTWSGPQTFTTDKTYFRRPGLSVGLEIGAIDTATTPYIDFHSSGNDIDYDARIIASGGSSESGNGSISLELDTFYVDGDISVTGKTFFKGVTDGSSELTGYAGEVLTASASSITQPNSATIFNITQLTLTPGDWDVFGSASVNFSSGGSYYLAGLSLASAATDNVLYCSGGPFTIGAGIVRVAPSARRINVSSNTTVYLIFQGNFSTGSLTAAGQIYARRAR